MFLEVENGEVFITEEGKMLKSYQELNGRDRHMGKPWVNACLVFTFFMWKRGGMFSNLLPVQRADRICSEMLDGKYKPDDFEKDFYYNALKNDYVNLQYSPTEILYEGLKVDIQDILTRLKNIPFTRRERVEVTAEFPNQEGIMTKQKVMANIEFDNSEEKMRAITLAEKLIDYETKLRTKILAETKEKRKEQNLKRLFD